MGYKKYAKDYKTEVYADLRGRLHTKAWYAGKHFAYKADEKQVRRALIRDTGMTLLSWAALLGALCMNSLAGRTWYVVFPGAASLFPLLYLSWSLITAWSHKAPLKREDADGVYQRRCSASLMGMIFPGIALLGFAVLCIRNGGALFIPQDLLFGALLLAVELLAVLLFRGRGVYELTELPETGDLSETD